MLFPPLAYWCVLSTFLGLVGLALLLYEEMRAPVEADDRTVRYIFCRYES